MAGPIRSLDDLACKGFDLNVTCRCGKYERTIPIAEARAMFRAHERSEAATASDGVIWSMRARIAKCRRLEATVMDDQASKALLELASEIERDVLRLKAGRDGHPNWPSLPRGL
jgi:hypothetical protein